MFSFLRAAAPASPLAAIIAAVHSGAITLIDVRDMTEVRPSGKAAGAQHIPLMRVSDMCDPRHPDFVRGLALDKPVAVDCASGARSGMAAGMLRKPDFKDVTNIGELGDWVRAGGAVTPVARTQDRDHPPRT